ncbi:MAG: ABC-F family ATP-binding cassette domain-containing protein [Silvanigrellales bacterium]|nr:ABC-F family ATP-binding cassette domain-containing protein [Silvanigrellales bacterium]
MIRIENLKKSYGPRVILKGATYHFPRSERIALVGPNGAGKTTLLNILCGSEEADEGEILRPGGMTLGYLPQEPNPNPAPSVLEECLSGGGALQDLKTRLDAALNRMTECYSEQSHAAFEALENRFRAEGGYAMEARAKGILAGLGFDAARQRACPRSLSGGWRMRLELAKIFLNNPDFLILDEPTNHLDLPSLMWVEKYLGQFPGTLLFVSHDKDLLNRLSSYTLHLHAGGLESYKGNFDEFLVQREQRLEREQAQADTLRSRREHLQRFVERFGASATKARQAQSRVKMIARIQEMEESITPEETQDALAFRLPLSETSGREVLAVDDLSLGYDARTPLSRNLKLRVHRGQKIAVIGANGIGKSTLLKTIAGRLPALAGEVREGHKVKLAYFAQDQLEVLDARASVLSNVVGASATVTEKQARSLLGSFLFRGDDVFKPVGVLSGGEKSRVGLARILVQDANLLLLDEPTNHLDMTSCEILAQAIDDYEGTVVFVSHDRHFINEVCTHVFAMLPDGRGQLFEGDLPDYERLAAVSGFPNVLDPALDLGAQGIGTSGASLVSGPSGSPSKAGQSEAKPTGQGLGSAQDVRQASKESRKERQRLERAVEKAEKDMEALGAKLASLEERFSALPPADYKTLQSLTQEKGVLQESLAEAEVAWMAAQEDLAKLV